MILGGGFYQLSNNRQSILTSTIAEISINRPLFQSFDYLAPSTIQLGQRVLIPYGRGNQSLVGIVTGLASESQFKRLKQVESILDPTPILSPEQLQFARWMSNYYQQALGEVLFAMLPNKLRQNESSEAKKSSYLRLLALETVPGSKQKRLLELLSSSEGQQLSVSQTRLNGFTTPTINSLIKKSLIERVEHADEPSLWQGETQPALTPSVEQAKVLADIDITAKGCHLLYGVTGSGKTEVYLQLIERCLAAGKQALVLVPEIGLTPQTVSRFQKRFACPMAVLHSGLSDSERLNQWLFAQHGKVDIVLGTRSAVFAPLSKLGLIIIDEEHDASYKQQDGIRYQARDVAIKRAYDGNFPVILGSATPSLESLNNAWQGKYTWHQLTERTGRAQIPNIEMVDLRHAQLTGGLAERSIKRMRQHLTDGNQVMVFLNRRGWAPSVMCQSCGWLADCPNCDARLVLHQQSNQLKCHHCGWNHPKPQHCPACQSPELVGLGLGTEKQSDILAEQFADVPIVRIDRDTANQPGGIAKLLSDVPDEGPALIVGTQMLAKGHHIPNITLVVVTDGDAGFWGVDYRASERMAQLLTQVAGRAGRGDRHGEVLVQSRYPEHPFFSQLINFGYLGSARHWLSERQQALLPPYHAHAIIRCDAPQDWQAAKVLRQLTEQLIAAGINIRVLGPVPATMAKRANLYRQLLHLHSDKRSELNRWLGYCRTLLQSMDTKQASWRIDVDPIDVG